MKDVKRKDIIGIAILIILVITILSIYYYNSESEKIDHDKQEYLKAINELKIDQIVQWRKERLSTAKFFPTIGKLIKHTEELRKNQNIGEAKSYFNKSLLPFKLNHYYENVFITELNGSILFSLDSTYSITEERTTEIIKQAVENDSVIFSDFYYNSKDETIYFDLVSPIKNNDGEIIAAIIQRTEPSHSIYQLINKWPSESKSAESYIFKRLGNRIIFLSELRHKSNAKLDFTIPASDTNVTSVKGILGRQGKLEGIDYRGLSVLANLQKIHGTDWFLISEIDKNEIYKDIIYRIETLIAIVLISMTALLLGYLFLKKSKQSKQFENKFLKEKELVEIQKEFRTTLYSIGDAVITSDSNGRIKYMNTVAESLTGWTESEASGLPLEKVFIIINETTREKIDNPVQKVMKQGTVVSLANHTLLISKQGKEIPIADSGAPIKDLNGNIIGVVLVFRDQTDERAKEKAILESEEKFRKMTLNSPMGMHFYELRENNSLVLIGSNPAADKLLGIDHKMFLGKTIEDAFPQLANTEVPQRYIEAASKGILWATEQISYKDDKIEGAFEVKAYQTKPNNMVAVFTDITERKRFETVLKNERDRISAILNLIVDPIFVKDDHHRFTFGNKAFFEMIGLDEKDVIGKTLAENIPDDEMKLFLKVDRLVLDTGITDTREEELTINNQTKTIITSKTRLTDDSGNRFLIGSLHDITDRKNAEKEKAHFNDLMKYIISNTKSSISVFDTKMNYIYVSDRYFDDFHLADRNIIGRNHYEVFPDLPQFLRDIHSRSLRGETINGGGDPLALSDGSLVWSNWTCMPWYNNDETIGGIIVYLEVITDRKKAEEELKKLSRAIEQSTATIMMTSADGTIEYVNPRFSQVTGYTLEEAVGKNPRILKSDYTSKEEYSDLWKTILSGREWRGVFYNRKKNGELYWESTIISPIVNNDGKISNFVAIKEDITEQKRTTEELIRSKEKAEEMNRIKSYFYANMSHELRTPFVGILGYSELLVDVLTDPEHQQMAKQIFTSSKRLTETLNNILNITKIEFDRIVPLITQTNLYALLHEIKSLYEIAAKQRNTELILEYEHSSEIIPTDAKLLREVLVNLINNAIKFTSNGFIKIKAECIVEGKDEMICIKVSDTGLGIPKEKQNLIWHEFRQVSEGLNRSFEGTGLGLTITKKYVEILGGNISLESEMGKGSVFIITLPLLKNFLLTEPETVVTANAAGNISEQKKQKRPHLLYVDDDIVSREFIKLVVERTGCTLDISPNADEVLRLINEKKYDGFLIDINLGSGMDGLELVKNIQIMNNYKNTPAIAITAYASDSDREEFLANGFTHYLSKPFGVDELKSLLTNIFFS